MTSADITCAGSHKAGSLPPHARAYAHVQGGSVCRQTSERGISGLISTAGCGDVRGRLFCLL